MTGGLEERLQQDLAQRKASNAYRTLNTSPDQIDLVSNDYLGLGQTQAILPQLSNSLIQPGATGSRLLSGNLPLHETVEAELAAFHEVSSALLCNTGYQANLALLSSLMTRDDTIFYDAYLHASLRQGLQLSNARCYKFRHNDIGSLAQKYRAAKGRVLIVVESLYSMDGDEAPLEALADFCHAHCCDLVVDEAHATGIMGQQGEGLVQAKGLAACVTARIHTFGKAVGTQGAVILGSQTLKAYLVNFAKPFIYTTALPPVLLQCIRNSYYTFPRMHEARQKVKSLSQYLEEQLVAQGRTVIHGRGPIKALIVPGNDHVKRLAAYLQEAGFDVRPILAPTVPQGQERLRICLHAYNTFAQLDALLTAIHQYTETTTTSVSPHA